MPGWKSPVVSFADNLLALLTDSSGTEGMSTFITGHKCKNGKDNIGHPSHMKELSDQLAAKIVNAVLEERCASEEGMRRYRPLLEERAQRIVARFAADPGEDSRSNDDPLDQIHALFRLADTIVKNELSSNRYPKQACPDDGGCIMCCTHMQIALSVQEAAIIARALLELTEAEKAEIAHRLPSLGKSGPGSRCGLLGEQGLCTLYAARPINCRTHRSCSIAACEDRVRRGRNAGEEVVFAYPFDDLIRKSFHHAVQPNRTPHFLEMNTFLSSVLHDDERLSAWASGQMPAENDAWRPIPCRTNKQKRGSGLT